ncbi:MAG: hypothetical protein ACREBF_01625 [Candidatus Micrarchaeales archaeon]
MDYTSAAEKLEGIEQGYEQKRVVLDPKQALAEQIKISDYSYEDAVRTISGMEIPLAEQQSAQQKTMINVPNVNMGQAATQIKQRIGDVEIGKRVVSMDKEMIDAAKDIGRFVGSAGKGFEELVGEQILKSKTSKLVLPNLALQDQVNELQGINDALGQNALDAEQIKIVKLEIAGVEISRKREKIDASQAAVLAMRDKLLSDIGNRLKSANT